MRASPIVSVALVGVALGARCVLFPSLDSPHDDAGSNIDSSAIDSTTSDGGASDAPVTAFCGSVDATFCDDFDQDDGSLSRWPARNTSSCTAIGIAPSDASPPNAVIFAVGQGQSSCSIGKPFVAPATTRMYYAFMVNVGAHSSTVNLSPIKPTGSTNGGSLYVSIRSSSTFSESPPTSIDSGTIDHTLAIAIPNGQWVHVEIIITLGSSPMAEVLLDGALALGSTALNSAFTYTAPEIVAGISFQGTGGTGTSLMIDDVVFDYE